jgi:transketolase
VSDAELNAGSTWEAIMFAAHHLLGRLVTIVDLNGQQALGYTRDVLDLDPVADRFTSFGWDVAAVDGHDEQALARTLAIDRPDPGRPLAVIAQTVAGKGVSFMERSVPWHYLSMTEDQYRQALDEVGEDRQ